MPAITIDLPALPTPPPGYRITHYEVEAAGTIRQWHIAGEGPDLARVADGAAEDLAGALRLVVRADGIDEAADLPEMIAHAALDDGKWSAWKSN